VTALSHGMVLAAGLGLRMRPLTRTRRSRCCRSTAAACSTTRSTAWGKRACGTRW
jgi:hypothetical protein